jgi:isocitrate/isopropylmalate dehydrogenase
MKIEIRCKETDYICVERMYIDGKFVAKVGGGEPEDQVIGRDLISCSEISRLMKLAFDAAKNGETLEIEYIDLTNNEE